MTEQLSLLVAPDPDWLLRPESKIEWEFQRFHTTNPEVYRRLEVAALAWADTNPKRIGVKRLVENLRYSALEIDRTFWQAFKLNDHNTALYARLLIHRHPRLEGIIEVRRRTEAGASVP